MLKVRPPFIEFSQIRFVMYFCFASTDILHQHEWEAYCTTLANAGSDEAMLEEYKKLQTKLKIDTKIPARVVFARDTRASGSRLVGCLVAALEAVGAEYVDYKILTTPQLHFMVRCINTAGTPEAYGEPSEKGYYEKLGGAFKRALGNKKPVGGLTVDCANGVGGPKLKDLIKYLPEDKLTITVVNDNVHQPDSLNVEVSDDERKPYLSDLELIYSQCGADYVKTSQRAPPSSKAGPGDRCCSLDGDADRVVFYFKQHNGTFALLDGDRIATLAALFLGDLVRQSGLADNSEPLKIGVVQTAYANGASTHYIEKDLKLAVTCTPTGVKHLHHAAEFYDVGVYFEANGHGTVIFSDHALQTIATHEPKSPAQQFHLETLRSVIDLINQAVGDALSDALLVEVILAHKEWTPTEWLATYNDLPNRLLKVQVSDRSNYVTEDAERKLVSPHGMQAKIDDAVRKTRQGRSFARPSGTEDVVRVYAEAASRAEADDLATKVAQIVKS
jgi:phosphoacetylglucosamine mutase